MIDLIPVKEKIVGYSNRYSLYMLVVLSFVNSNPYLDDVRENITDKVARNIPGTILSDLW